MLVLLQGEFDCQEQSVPYIIVPFFGEEMMREVGTKMKLTFILLDSCHSRVQSLHFYNKLVRDR